MGQLSALQNQWFLGLVSCPGFETSELEGWLAGHVPEVTGFGGPFPSLEGDWFSKKEAVPVEELPVQIGLF